MKTLEALPTSVDVCMCEPFVLPGFLPTLGTPTLKAEFSTHGVSSKVFYPSIRFFARNNLQCSDFVMSAVDNIPLQFSEFLFATDNIEESIDYILETLNRQDESLRQVARKLAVNAQDLLKSIADEIADLRPAVLCHSVTFGDYNFAFNLFKEVKSRLPDIKIVVGGSNCTIDFSEKLLDVAPEIDYVVCDETYTTTIQLVQSIINHQETDYPTCTTQKKCAARVNKVVSLEDMPCPDFDDFFETLVAIGHTNYQIILPYEMSRGCWWGEKHPCKMCGYFGNQTCFLIKSPDKVASELNYLKEKYGTSYFRLTDLVQPKREYISQLRDMGLNDTFHLFWEMRPNVSETDIATLRSIGLFYAQAGLESLSSAELKHINKGTTAINNIAVLRHCYTYKIHVVWNYLYGFEDDRAEWYESAIEMMPLLYHLQPPDPREVWINKCSVIYANANRETLRPIGDNIFYTSLTPDFNVFFSAPKNPDLMPVYDKLRMEIGKWKDAFNSGFALYEEMLEDGSMKVIREYGENVTSYNMTPIQAAIYQYCHTPRSKQQLSLVTEGADTDIDALLANWIREGVMVYIDDKYLSLATSASPYRWHRFQVLPNI